MSRWIPIAEAKIVPHLTCLIIGPYPTGRGWSDPYVAWANRDGSWVRWPHPFPPTHLMQIEPATPDSPTLRDITTGKEA